MSRRSNRKTRNTKKQRGRTLPSSSTARTITDMAPNANSFEVTAEVAKVDESLGLVFGWAIICKRNGKEYFDLQGDHIPEDSMLKAAADFMANSRRADEMHSRKNAGSVVFAFPLTEETAKAFDLTTKQTGLMIAMKPDADMLAKFVSGEYTGFSIGGRRVKDDPVD